MRGEEKYKRRGEEITEHGKEKKRVVEMKKEKKLIDEKTRAEMMG